MYRIPDGGVSVMDQYDRLSSASMNHRECNHSTGRVQDYEREQAVADNPQMEIDHSCSCHRHCHCRRTGHRDIVENLHTAVAAVAVAAAAVVVDVVAVAAAVARIEEQIVAVAVGHWTEGHASILAVRIHLVGGQQTAAEVAADTVGAVGSEEHAAADYAVVALAAGWHAVATAAAVVVAAVGVTFAVVD